MLNLQLDDRRKRKSKKINVSWETNLIYEIPQNHNYDLIFVSVNIEQISSVVKALNNKVNNATVLFFNNFWEDPIKQTEILPQTQIIFGFPGAGGGTVGTNTINGAFSSIIMIGDIGKASKERVQQVYTLFEQAEFSLKRQTNFKKFLLNHFLLNVAVEIEVLKEGSFIGLMDSIDALGNISINLRQLKPIMKERGMSYDALNTLLSTISPKIIGIIMSKFIFKSGSTARSLMEGNNTITGRSAKLILDEARRKNIHVNTLENISKLLT
ncbi:ketopantoate reductase family protein [Bacillus circulans]|nr:ketopantoate reductase family protein [Niallia circulans]NRG28324.1 ketopantoate reductase family protein [Niallia circulans]QJX61174.1 ketopantoate reductase family protein [Niallia circulans]